MFELTLLQPPSIWLMRHIGQYFSLLLLFFCSCGNHQHINEFDPQDLCETVMLIDFVNNDIIKSQSPTAVSDLINLDTGVPYDADEINEARAHVAKDWSKFVKFIRRHQYKKASEFIMDTDNQGSVLLFWTTGIYFP